MRAVVLLLLVLAAVHAATREILRVTCNDVVHFHDSSFILETPPFWNNMRRETDMRRKCFCENKTKPNPPGLFNMGELIRLLRGESVDYLELVNNKSDPCDVDSTNNEILNIEFPASCTAEAWAEGKPCYFSMPVFGGMRLLAAVEHCGTGTDHPFISLSCDGPGCDTILAPCLNNSDCNGKSSCHAVDESIFEEEPKCLRATCRYTDPRGNRSPAWVPAEDPSHCEKKQKLAVCELKGANHKKRQPVTTTGAVSTTEGTTTGEVSTTEGTTTGAVPTTEGTAATIPFLPTTPAAPTSTTSAPNLATSAAHEEEYPDSEEGDDGDLWVDLLDEGEVLETGDDSQFADLWVEGSVAEFDGGCHVCKADATWEKLTECPVATAAGPGSPYCRYASSVGSLHIYDDLLDDTPMGQHWFDAFHTSEACMGRHEFTEQVLQESRRFWDDRALDFSNKRSVSFCIPDAIAGLDDEPLDSEEAIKDLFDCDISCKDEGCTFQCADKMSWDGKFEDGTRVKSLLETPRLDTVKVASDGAVPLLYASCDGTGALLPGSALSMVGRAPEFSKFVPWFYDNLFATQQCRAKLYGGSLDEDEFLSRFWGLDMIMGRLTNPLDTGRVKRSFRMPDWAPPEESETMLSMPKTCSAKRWREDGECTMSWSGLESLTGEETRLNMRLARCTGKNRGNIEAFLECKGEACQVFSKPLKCRGNSECNHGMECFDLMDLTENDNNGKDKRQFLRTTSTAAPLTSAQASTTSDGAHSSEGTTHHFGTTVPDTAGTVASTFATSFVHSQATVSKTIHELTSAFPSFPATWSVDWNTDIDAAPVEQADAGVSSFAAILIGDTFGLSGVDGHECSTSESLIYSASRTLHYFGGDASEYRKEKPNTRFCFYSEKSLQDWGEDLELQGTDNNIVLPGVEEWTLPPGGLKDIKIKDIEQFYRTGVTVDTSMGSRVPVWSVATAVVVLLGALAF